MSGEPPETNSENHKLSVIEDVETGNRFVVYTTASGTHLEPRFDGEEPWFTQRDLATLFGVDVRTVSEHIQSFTEGGELDDSTIRDFRIVRQEGNRTVERPITHYGLDVAFYVGYRVNSTEGKIFRRWATRMLVQLAVHGYVVDKRRLRGDPSRLSKLREIIKELRSDEANIYAELRQILSMCKDYDPKLPETRQFFAHFQDCLLYAIVEKTSTEIKMTADASTPNMGLTTWHEDHEYPLQTDATNSKNYLGQLQLEDLNRLVTMVLDFFEDQVSRGWLVSMADADAKLEEILTVNKRIMLTRFGKVKTERADAHAKAQYKIFDETRRAEWKANALAELNSKAKALPRPKRKT
jgi:hypothetical protein